MGFAVGVMVWWLLWSCCNFAGCIGCYGCYGFVVILKVDFVVVVAMVFAMILYTVIL